MEPASCRSLKIFCGAVISLVLSRQFRPSLQPNHACKPSILRIAPKKRVCLIGDGNDLLHLLDCCDGLRSGWDERASRG